MLRCKRAVFAISERTLSQSAIVGREARGGAGRTQSGVPMADVKGTKSMRWRVRRRIAHERHEVIYGEGGPAQVLEGKPGDVRRIIADECSIIRVAARKQNFAVQTSVMAV